MPLIGIIPQLVCEKLLLRRAKNIPDENVPRYIALLEAKNHYKICAIIRNILTIAAIITCISCGIFSAWAIAPIVGLTAWTTVEFIRLYHNREILKDLRTTEAVFKFAESDKFIL